MRKATVVFAVVCLFAFVFTIMASAQEPAKVSGAWEMTFETPSGTRTQELTFEQTGDKIKGTMKGQRGESPLEGTVAGDKIAFTVTREFNGQTRTMNYTATVTGGSMKGSLKFGEREVEWTAKKKS